MYKTGPITRQDIELLTSANLTLSFDYKTLILNSTESGILIPQKGEADIEIDLEDLEEGETILDYPLEVILYVAALRSNEDRDITTLHEITHVRDLLCGYIPPGLYQRSDASIMQDMWQYEQEVDDLAIKTVREKPMFVGNLIEKLGIYDYPDVDYLRREKLVKFYG